MVLWHSDIFYMTDGSFAKIYQQIYKDIRQIKNAHNRITIPIKTEERYKQSRRMFADDIKNNNTVNSLKIFYIKTK